MGYRVEQYQVRVSGICPVVARCSQHCCWMLLWEFLPCSECVLTATRLKTPEGGVVNGLVGGHVPPEWGKPRVPACAASLLEQSGQRVQCPGDSSVDGLQHHCCSQNCQSHAQSNLPYLGNVGKELKPGLPIPACCKKGWLWAQGKSSSSVLHGPDLAVMPPARSSGWELRPARCCSKGCWARSVCCGSPQHYRAVPVPCSWPQDVFIAEHRPAGSVTVIAGAGGSALLCPQGAASAAAASVTDGPEPAPRASSLLWAVALVQLRAMGRGLSFAVGLGGHKRLPIAAA